MNNVVLANIFRFLGLILLQGLVLKNVGEGWEEFPYLFVIVYPLAIMLLPLRTPRVLTMLLGFIAGLIMDGFYSSPGIHTSAAVFMAFCRPFVLKSLEPRNGYNVNYSPTAARWGFGWFLRYTSIMLALYLFFYFSVEAFTFVYFGSILLKTIVSLITSMIFILIYQVIFNPVD